MLDFLLKLKMRNDVLFYFGLINLLLAIAFIVFTKVSVTQVSGANAWFKPFKFAASIGLYSWTMAWFCFYLKDFNLSAYSWTIVVLFGFEIIYIALQAARGQLSHFNISSGFYSAMFAMMGVVASVITLYTAYICVLFFTQSFADLPKYYVVSIQLALLIFIVFSFEGFVMGSRMSHTIGAADGSGGLPVLNWSTKYGDPRVSHFIGMHALQVLPLASYYLLKNTWLTIALGVLYAALAVFTLVQALGGRPLVRM